MVKDSSICKLHLKVITGENYDRTSKGTRSRLAPTHTTMGDHTRNNLCFINTAGDYSTSHGIWLR